jgi:diadenosine tetraphosphate (Ap4A) HIT family hydrolase
MAVLRQTLCLIGGDHHIGVAGIAHHRDAAIIGGHGVNGLALSDEDLAVVLQQVGAFHPRTARLGADQQSPVHVLEGDIGVAGQDHVLQQWEGAVFQLHGHALQRLLRTLNRDFQQLQNDWLVLAQHLARGDAEQQGIADIASGTGNGHADGFLGGHEGRSGQKGCRSLAQKDRASQSRSGAYADLMFKIDPAFLTTSHAVGDLGLCHVRLQDDARWPWLVLIPRVDGARELEDLSADDRTALMAEIILAGAAVQGLGVEVAKLNVGALGNVTPQLHVHVVGRWPGDPAWPGPVWGVAGGVAYSTADRLAVLAKAAERLGMKGDLSA